eukprot:scaffold18897_cov96-Skeletonema_marinoi.AAC.1
MPLTEWLRAKMLQHYNHAKSHYICKPEDEEVARAASEAEGPERMDTIIANCAERGPPSCPNQSGQPRALPSVKKGGLAICFSVEQAATCYKTSRAVGCWS